MTLKFINTLDYRETKKQKLDCFTAKGRGSQRQQRQARLRERSEAIQFRLPW